MSNVWQEIKDRLPVEEVLQDYIPVISQGNMYKAVCPFHREKHPSLIISKEKAIWHCFGCGQGGDIFAFVMQIENITKKEALEKLAKKAGVKLDSKPQANAKESTNPEDSTSAPDVTKFEQGLKLLNWTAEVYNKVLLKVLQNRDNPVTQYCLSRDLTPEIIEKFKLGYAPRNNFILELVKKYGLSDKLMFDVGIIKEKPNTESNPIYSDKFVDRLMIPVFNRQAKIVGFTGRVLPYDKTERPKYLNSPQTDWFNKSDLWFGWHLAKTAISQQKKAMIVEGNMDVISSFRHGFDFTLASQGTSFTENQLKILKSITKTIWLAFDNDEAGRISADKFFKTSGIFGLTVYKVVVPLEYKDLDEYLAEKNPQNLETLPYLDWALQSKNIQLRSGDSDVQKKAILEILDLMTNLDELSKEQYIKKLSDLCKISQNTLQSFLPKVVTDNSHFAELAPGYLAQQLNSEQEVYSNWQNLLAAVISQFPDKINILELSFIVLAKILPQLATYTSFANYIQENSQMLGFIYDQKEDLKNIQKIEDLYKHLITFVDSRWNEFKLDKDLKEAYLSLKTVKFD